MTAADGKWTFSLTAACGTDVQYKYTCGHGGDGWAGTEEYPLTNRGYTLPAGLFQGAVARCVRRQTRSLGDPRALQRGHQDLPVGTPLRCGGGGERSAAEFATRPRYSQGGEL